MEPLTPIGNPSRTLLTLLNLITLLSLVSSVAYAQTASPSARCAASAGPLQVRAEGLTERVADVVLQCSGFQSGAAISDNLALYFPVSVTNRIDTNSLTRDAVVSIDTGLGFVPTAVGGQVAGSRIVFNGVSFTVPPSGSFNVRVSNVRLDVNQLGAAAPQPVVANISSSLPLPQSQVTVASAQIAFFATLDDTGITCTGSPLPSTPTLADLFAAGAAFASTRLSESFGNAFLPRAAGEDNGTRFVVDYSGFPANATLYLPDLVAGSDALVPTAGGDLGLPQAVGQYLPGSGTLLLARVVGADATGAGGTPVAVPGGPGAATLNSVSTVPLTGGAGFAVYEVMDCRPDRSRERPVSHFHRAAPGDGRGSGARERRPGSRFRCLYRLHHRPDPAIRGGDARLRLRRWWAIARRATSPSSRFRRRRSSSPSWTASRPASLATSPCITTAAASCCGPPASNTRVAPAG